MVIARPTLSVVLQCFADRPVFLHGQHPLPLQTHKHSNVKCKYFILWDYTTGDQVLLNADIVWVLLRQPGVCLLWAWRGLVGAL